MRETLVAFIADMRIILSLGSNNNPEENIQKAEERLRSLFPAIRFSRTMMNEPYGEHANALPYFGNAVAVGAVSVPLPVLRTMAKALETHLGRSSERKHEGIIDIDIDILQYDTLRLKPDDWQRPYNIQLLKEMENIE